MRTPTSRTVRYAVAATGLVAMSAVGLSSLASAALFTDTRSTSAAAVTSGNVALNLGGAASSSLTVPAMAPGDTKYGIITAANTGSLQARVAAKASWSASNALTQALTLSVKQITNGSTTCDGTLTWASGTIVADATAGVGVTTVALYGSAATGAQAGDRTFDAATTETYCVRLVLPSSAGNSVASLTSDLSFRFDAEQTANNA